MGYGCEGQTLSGETGPGRAERRSFQSLSGSGFLVGAGRPFFGRLLLEVCSAATLA